jgi:hypothetical protein
LNKNKINIISFDVPLPADYGGVIDVFYKIKALNEAGFEIVLHCFQSDRTKAPELNKYCKEVFYYKRKSGIRYIFSGYPYITVTRKNKNLIRNLKTNNFPILFEGLHSCYFIKHQGIKTRTKLLRMHNVEHHYYSELSKAARNPYKKLFYRIESKKLLNFEKTISYASCIATISKNDFNYFHGKHNNVINLPAFHSLNGVVSKEGKGDYFLYHGNLSVEENEKAVLFLINQVLQKTNIKFVIAGKSPTSRIQQLTTKMNNIELISNPDERLMEKLIEDAHCCVLPTFQATGLKLKLLISLFKGRHVITNYEMVENTGLESICLIAKDDKDFIKKINCIQNVEFAKKDIETRQDVLEKFSNQNNIKKLIAAF